MNPLQRPPLNKDLFFHSPIVTPIKSHLFGGKGVSGDNENDSNLSGSILQNQQHVFKTPKQESGAIASKASVNVPNILQQQQEFKSIVDSTGSRFSVKLADNRLVRVNLSESSTCKLVNTCLEAFKYTLSKEIYYEIVQQWYIHRYSISGESLRDQLNVFLYLILNLCGCFDMNRLEQDLPLLSANKNKKGAELTSKSTAQKMQQQQVETPGRCVEEFGNKDGSNDSKIVNLNKKILD